MNTDQDRYEQAVAALDMDVVRAIHLLDPGRHAADLFPDVYAWYAQSGTVQGDPRVATALLAAAVLRLAEQSASATDADAAVAALHTAGWGRDRPGDFGLSHADLRHLAAQVLGARTQRRPITWSKQVSPRLAVVVDDGGCVCIHTPIGNYTVTNVEALRTALDVARTVQAVGPEPADAGDLGQVADKRQP